MWHLQLGGSVIKGPANLGRNSKVRLWAGRPATRGTKICCVSAGPAPVEVGVGSRSECKGDRRPGMCSVLPSEGKPG